jgi:DNA polymerase-3 subunit alpha
VEVIRSYLDEKLKWEKELLGLYVSSHPFAYYQKVGADKILKINDLEDYERDKWVVIGGVIEKATKKITKKGSMMMFATLQDLTGSIELMVFPKTYEQTQSIWQEGNIVCVQGKTPREEGDNKVFVEKAEILTKQNAANVIHMMTGGNNFASSENIEQQNKTQSVVIYITKQELQDKTEKLKQIFIEARVIIKYF